MPTSDFTSKMIQMHQKYSIFGNNFGDVCYAHDVNGSQSPLHPRWAILIIFCSGIKSTPRIKLFCPLLAGIESLLSCITHNELTWKIWSCFTAWQFWYKSSWDSLRHVPLDVPNDLLHTHNTDTRDLTIITPKINHFGDTMSDYDHLFSWSGVWYLSSRRQERSHKSIITSLWVPEHISFQD